MARPREVSGTASSSGGDTLELRSGFQDQLAQYLLQRAVVPVVVQAAVVAERGVGRGCRLHVVVLVVGWDRLQAVEPLELDSGRQQFPRRPEQLTVVRPAAQAARDAEDPH